MTTIEFSADQEAALNDILTWRAGNPHGASQYRTLGGLAGTGKTTIIAYLAGIWPNVAVAAVTGKAAYVLRSKGVAATTVHRLISFPFRGPGGLVFRKRRRLDGVETLIVDEASMIGHLLWVDLLSFNLPTLFVGDHGQLEPIGTTANLMKAPDVRLETIHRQAFGNPILRLAMAFREGRPTPPWDDPRGRLRITGKAEFERLIRPGVQIICGFNGTRHWINQKVRSLLEVTMDLVAPGETLVCLKNNRRFNVFNGQQVTVLGVVGERSGVIDVEVEDDDGRAFILPCLTAQFGRDTIQDHTDQRVALMDYGACLTAHKAQGSEWDEVLVLEQIPRECDPRRWRYTAATRAKERLVYCR